MIGPKTEARPTAQPTVRNAPHGTNALSAELAELLRTGPFEAALRTAIRASRLSLERIQHRLRFVVRLAEEVRMTHLRLQLTDTRLQLLQLLRQLFQFTRQVIA